MKRMLKLLIVLLLGYVGLLLYNLVGDFQKPFKVLNEEKTIDITDLELEKYSDDLYILVNSNTELTQTYETNLKIIEGFEVDKFVKKPLEALLKDARSEGILIEINQAYRSPSYQQEVFDSKVEEYVNKGYSLKDATKATHAMVALPRHSEHETGLALDFVTSGNENDKFEMWEWLFNNAYKYGFNLRYPAHKTQITGVVYEPWHYRYLGQELALYMKQNDLVLEEVYEYLD